MTGGGEDELRDSMNHRRGSAKIFSYLFSSTSSSSTNKKTDEQINPSITGDHELMNIGNPMLLSKSGFDLIDLNNPPQGNITISIYDMYTILTLYLCRCSNYELCFKLSNKKDIRRTVSSSLIYLSV